MNGLRDEPQAMSPIDPEPVEECRPDSIIDLARTLQRQLAVRVWVECGRPWPGPRWARIFLVEPTEPVPARMGRLLAADHVIVIPDGDRVPLLGSNAAGAWRWVHCPGHRPIQPPARTWLLHQVRPLLTSSHRRGTGPGPTNLRETP